MILMWVRALDGTIDKIMRGTLECEAKGLKVVDRDVR